MPKPAHRSHSRYARQATELLGCIIHATRIERALTVAELAERAGVSRGLVHRVEKGDPGCSIGAVFELAAILGVPLFGAEPNELTNHLLAARREHTLLPEAVRSKTKRVKDDF